MQEKTGTIKKQDIDLLATKQIESVIFDLTDSLGKRDVKSALNTLNGLIYNKEPIQKILITLYNHFKKLFLLSISLLAESDSQIGLTKLSKYPIANTVEGNIPKTPR